MADLALDNAQTAATVVAAPALSCLQGSTISAGPEFSNGLIRAAATRSVSGKSAKSNGIRGHGAAAQPVWTINLPCTAPDRGLLVDSA